MRSQLPTLELVSIIYISGLFSSANNCHHDVKLFQYYVFVCSLICFCFYRGLVFHQDAVFEAKEDLALAVKNALQETMSEYGYQILQALITDIDPDQRVKNAMNEINSAKRLKFAIAEKAEGQKM